MHRILLVDDEPNILHALRRILRGADRELEYFEQPVEALRCAQVTSFDLIISDYRMPEMDGISLLQEIRQLQPDSVRIVLSGYADLEAVLAAVNQAEIYRFLCKPWEEYELQTAVKHALQHHDLLLENRILADQVREQENTISRQDTLLAALEARHPGITQVNWGPDGSILLDESDI